MAALDDAFDGAAERRAARDRLVPDFAGDGLTKADLVIEAIAEDPSAKQKLYASLEARLPAGAITATNASSLPLECRRDGLQRPERLVGLHFFNSVAKMQLVEVIADSATDPDVVRRARAFCERIGKLPARHARRTRR